MVIRLVIPGPPVPWRRARRAGRRTYTDPKDRAYRARVATMALGARPRGWPLDAAYSVAVRAYFGDARRHDADNTGKSPMDALIGVLWDDDSRVRRLLVELGVDREQPRLELDVEVVS